MSEENVEIVQRAFDAYSRGELEGVLEHLASDVEFHTSGRFTGTAPVYHGHEGWREFWATFQEAWEQISIEVQRIEDLGDEVLVLGTFHATGRGSGAQVSLPTGWLGTVGARRISRLRTFGSWSEALDAAGLSESQK